MSHHATEQYARKTLIKIGHRRLPRMTSTRIPSLQYLIVSSHSSMGSFSENAAISIVPAGAFRTLLSWNVAYSIIAVSSNAFSNRRASSSPADNHSRKGRSIDSITIHGGISDHNARVIFAIWRVRIFYTALKSLPGRITIPSGNAFLHHRGQV